MNIKTEQLRHRGLALGALAGACFAATLGIATDQADAAYKAKVTGGTLQLTGDKASDNLTLQLGATPNILTVDVNSDGTPEFSFDRSTFSSIDVAAGGGDDRIAVSRNGGSFTDEAVTLDGGPGDDTLIGSDGNDTLIGGAGNDFADGNIGADRALMGSGDDRFNWDPGDGSDTVEGEGGNDTLVFNGSNAPENVDISANGPRVRFFRDVAAITMDLDGVEGVDFNALGSADKTTVGDLSGTDLRTVDVNLAATGGGGDASADTVIANGTGLADAVSVDSDAGSTVVSGLASQVRVTGGEVANDVVKVNGSGGTDTVTYNGTGGSDDIGIANNGTAVRTFTPAALGLDTTAVANLVIDGLGGDDAITGQNGIATLTDLTIDGGVGNDDLRGGDGDDLLIGGTGNDIVDGNRGNDVALLGSGDDRFTWDPGDGSDTIEGQAGNDVLGFNGSNIGEKIDVSANGSRMRLFRDVAAITMDSASIERLEVNTIGGADSVTIGDMTGTGLKAADLNLAATGGAGDGSADTVIVNGSDKADNVKVLRAGAQAQVTGLATQTRIAGSEAANDVLRVNTLGGKDRVSVAPDVATLIGTIVDFGSGQ
jgi:Ca2+-binding RTX toxin-like protein